MQVGKITIDSVEQFWANLQLDKDSYAYVKGLGAPDRVERIILDLIAANRTFKVWREVPGAIQGALLSALQPDDAEPARGTPVGPTPEWDRLKALGLPLETNAPSRKGRPLVGEDGAREIVEFFARHPLLAEDLRRRKFKIVFHSRSAEGQGGGYYHHGSRAVELSSEVTDGAPEVLLDLLLHEFGHATLQRILTVDLKVDADFREAWKVLSMKEGEAMVGVDLRGKTAHPLRSEQGRRQYQAGSYAEFCAEMFMLHLRHRERLLAAHASAPTDEVRSAWDKALRVLAWFHSRTDADLLALWAEFDVAAAPADDQLVARGRPRANAMTGAPVKPAAQPAPAWKPAAASNPAAPRHQVGGPRPAPAPALAGPKPAPAYAPSGDAEGERDGEPPSRP